MVSNGDIKEAPDKVVKSLMENFPPDDTHNWLYSFIPAYLGGVDSIYLTGFCKNCRRAFSQYLPSGMGYSEIQTEVPKGGCNKAYA